MDTAFQIPFRTVRIGSLKTYPPRDAHNYSLKLTKNNLSFKVVLGHKGLKNDSMKIDIPCDGITHIEAHLTIGCPVIWITTNDSTTEMIRSLTEMKLTSQPSPYFDAKSNELAERRLCIIPADDPIEQSQLENFRMIIQVMADERSISMSKLFTELSRVNCNEQLIRCTQYISQLTKFQSSFRIKKEIEMETRSVVIGTEVNGKDKDTKKEDYFIVISSDEDESGNKKNPLATEVENNQTGSTTQTENGNNSNSPSTETKNLNFGGMATKSKEEKSFSTLSYSSKSPLRRKYIIPKRQSSPDLLDFDNDSSPESSRIKHQKLDF